MHYLAQHPVEELKQVCPILPGEDSKMIREGGPKCWCLLDAVKWFTCEQKFVSHNPQACFNFFILWTNLVHAYVLNNIRQAIDEGCDFVASGHLPSAATPQIPLQGGTWDSTGNERQG